MTKRYFGLDTGYQNQQHNDAQDHNINFLAQVRNKSSNNGHQTRNEGIILFLEHPWLVIPKVGSNGQTDDVDDNGSDEGVT